ncbi:hypothetical protein [Streptomyces fragilis]|uniref:hypothetical protein n=1 Tax=Streptomyces fragilis TaxID=67301 RepID=UPI0024DEE390|nr:hypothetical protein [Streptomyces fragilis]
MYPQGRGAQAAAGGRGAGQRVLDQGEREGDGGRQREREDGTGCLLYTSRCV